MVKTLSLSSKYSEFEVSEILTKTSSDGFGGTIHPKESEEVGVEAIILLQSEPLLMLKSIFTFSAKKALLQSILTY